MRFILENPSFASEPIEIDNETAVRQITACINKSIMLGDEIIIGINGVLIKLRIIDANGQEYRFKNVKFKRL